MKERICAAGETIYTEGEVSDYVYVIQRGEVEVAREANGRRTVLAKLNAGQIFGETGIIRDRRRSTTTRALDEVALVAISKENFLGAFDPDNPIVLPILRMLCERLGSADQQVVEGFQADGVAPKEVKRIRLLPGSHQVETQIGADGAIVKKLPFRVGRRARPDDPRLSTPTSLALAAQEPLHLSPEHFVIETESGEIVVRDLGSELGTVVNGRRIASFEHNSVSGLRFGENRIVAGGAQSPYQFMLVIDKK